MAGRQSIGKSKGMFGGGSSPGTSYTPASPMSMGSSPSHVRSAGDLRSRERFGQADMTRLPASGATTAAQRDGLFPSADRPFSSATGTGHRPFYEERKELEKLWKTSDLNKFYTPMSRLPPLGGPDPRRIFAGQPPTCYMDLGVPRAQRIMMRWESIQQLPSQLPSEHLRQIRQATSAASSQDRPAEGNRGTPGDPHRNSQDIRCRGCKGLPIKNDGPHIPCTCCERPGPKPWLEKKSLGAVAAALVAEASAPSAGPGPVQTVSLADAAKGGCGARAVALAAAAAERQGRAQFEAGSPGGSKPTRNVSTAW